MSNLSSKPSENFIPVQYIAPRAFAATTPVTSSYSSGKGFNSYAAIAFVTNSAAGTLTVQIIQADDTSGTNAAIVSGATISFTGSASATGATGNAVMINYDPKDVNITSHFIAVCVIPSATSVMTGSAALYGFNPRYGPASDENTNCATAG